MNIRIFTDGSCKNNGKQKNSGSYGLVIIAEKDKILYEHAELVPNTTNNRMEMVAILKAFELSKLVNFKTCIIYSDSRYCVDGYNSWMNDWVKKGWKTSDKKEVKNRDLWQQLSTFKKLSKGITVQWMKGHQNKNTWNDYIDQKIVSLHSKKDKTTQMTKKGKEPIIIDIPLDDLSEQKIIDKKVYSIELHENYLKFEYDFLAEETDYEEYSKTMDKYEGDEVLQQVYRDDKPTKEVHRRQISYTDKNDISSIFFIKNSDNKEGLAMVILSIRDGDEQSLLFKDESLAQEALDKLLRWRWE